MLLRITTDKSLLFAEMANISDRSLEMFEDQQKYSGFQKKYILIKLLYYMFGLFSYILSYLGVCFFLLLNSRTCHLT